MSQRIFSTWTALVCAVLLPSAAGAAGPTAMVAGTGEASVRLVPTKLRMQMQIEAHGKTTELAIQRLKARREAAADNLCALGAEKQSLNFGDPSVNKVVPPTGPSYAPPSGYAPFGPPSYGTPVPASSQAPSTYVPSGSAPNPSPSSAPLPTLTPVPVPSPLMPPRTLAPPATPVYPSPVPVTTYLPPSSNPVAPPQPRGSGLSAPVELYAATATLTVEWPLQAETVEQAVLAAEAIRKKLAGGGDLMGGKAAEKLPADEQELLDEQIVPHTTSQIIQRPVLEALPGGGSSIRYVSEQVVTAPGALPAVLGRPPFQYVATISSQQRKALLAEAFGNAKSQAAEVAEAAGRKLGAISNMSGDVSTSRPGEAFTSDGILQTCSPAILAPNENSNEAIAIAPGGLKFHAKVRVLFLLE